MRRRSNRFYTTLTMAWLAILSVSAQDGCSDTNSTNGSIDSVDARPSDDATYPLDSGIQPDGADPDSSMDPEKAMLSIYVEGDVTPKPFDDGLSGQTPQNYLMYFSSVELLRSFDDATPLVLADHGDGSMEVDMLSKTRVVHVPSDSLPLGVYTHGRARLAAVSFDIDATVHHQEMILPGQVEVFGVLSDTIVDGVQRSKGEASYTFMGYTVQGTLPPLPSTAIGALIEEDGSTYLVFAFSQPVFISSVMEQDMTVTIVFEVHESFRWQDQDLPGFQPQVFDVTTSMESEPVVCFGATGYRIEMD